MHNQEQEIEIGELDGRYVSIAPFREWSADTSLRSDLVDSAQEDFERALKTTTEPLLSKTLQDVVVAAALETGAIEGLYKQSTGVTLSLIEGAISASQAIDEATEGRPYDSRLVAGQREAYQIALDIVTDRRPFTEVLVREIHTTACAGQDTYRVKTAIGWEDRELPKGTYKTHPNHVLQEDGSFHAYCPVHDVATEMDHLIQNMRDGDLQAAHPILQAAYIHHTFTHIHPFSDGNGRTARVLASIPLIRAYRLPLVVLADRNAEYRTAQAAADVGKCQSFVSLIEEMVIDILQLIALRLRSADQTEKPELAALIDSQISTRRSSSATRRASAERLEALLEDVVTEVVDNLEFPDSVTSKVAWGSGGGGGPKGYTPMTRLLFAQAVAADITPPNEVKSTFKVSIAVAEDEERPLSVKGSGPELLVRINEVHPRPKQAFRLRLQAWAAAELNELPQKLLKTLGG